MDDVVGGRAQVIDVTEKAVGDNKVISVKTLQHPGRSYNWRYLAGEQERLKEEFGESLAYPDPDYRLEFNMWD